MESDTDIRSNNIKVEAEIKMAEKKDMELTPPTNTLKKTHQCHPSSQQATEEEHCHAK